MIQLSGRIALVTGGASGIGRASALALGRAGARVWVSDLDEDGAQKTAAAIAEAGGVAAFSGHDVTDEGAWNDTVARVQGQFGALHILLNNAGIAWAGSIVDMTLADWRRQTGVNLDGVFLGVRTAIPAMRESGAGSIINVSSVAGIKGSPTLAGYCATKGGVRLFTKAVALECARNRWPIRVNSVHPGIIETPIWQQVIPTGGGVNAADVAERASAMVPNGQLGQPSDIANGVVFLASDLSAYMNGAELVLDAGMTA